MLNRTTGTSPFQPRSPPVYWYRTPPAPVRSAHRSAISRTVRASSVSDVVILEPRPALAVEQEDGVDHVIDMDIGLALEAVAENRQVVRVA